MYENTVCIWCVYMPVRISLVVCIDFYSMHCTRNIKKRGYCVHLFQGHVDHLCLMNRIVGWTSVGEVRVCFWICQ